MTLVGVLVGLTVPSNPQFACQLESPQTLSNQGPGPLPSCCPLLAQRHDLHGNWGAKCKKTELPGSAYKGEVGAGSKLTSQCCRYVTMDASARILILLKKSVRNPGKAVTC